MIYPTASFSIAQAETRLAAERVGAGPPVLLLHAGGETRAVWRPVMQTLAKRGYLAEAYDQRGHGESGGSPVDGVLAYGEDAKAMICRLDRPIVVGGSLGGFALMLALESFESQASGLVLVDVTPAPNADRTRAYLAPRAGLGTSPLVGDILSRSRDLSRIVAQLRLPILLVCGGIRSPVGEEGRARFSELCPNAEIEVLANAGHLVARDAPQELAALISDFADRFSAR